MGNPNINIIGCGPVGRVCMTESGSGLELKEDEIFNISNPNKDLNMVDSTSDRKSKFDENLIPDGDFYEISTRAKRRKSERNGIKNSHKINKKYRY